jgi:phosphoribosylformimino-5-aminoimidazole carboxamide ribotide isomerase
MMTLMEIIPVLDLKGGVVVRARLGQRDHYRPIETPLSPTSRPEDVARGLRSVFPFRTIYLADLDAIEGKGDNADALMRLRGECPGVTFWVDNGTRDAAAAERWLEVEAGHLVLGSESLADLAPLRRLSAHERLVLSLDFGGDGFRGPRDLLADPSLWPRRVIAMTLARVGSGAGPDLVALERIRRMVGGRQLYAAGGVRDAADLAGLAHAGIAGALVATALHDGRLGRTDVEQCHAEPAQQRGV